MYWNWKKIGIGILIALLVLGGGAYGVYRYTLARYSHQIEDMLSGLIGDSADESAQQPETSPEDASVQPKGSTDSAAANTSIGQTQPPVVTDGASQTNDTGTGKTSTPNATEQEPGSPPVADPETAETTQPPETAAPKPPSGTAAVVVEATEGLQLSDSEMEMVSDLPSLLKQMTAQEKLMLVKTLAKFSPSELLGLYREYSSGDADAQQAIKEAVKTKFSAEDINLIKQMVAKYR